MAGIDWIKGLPKILTKYKYVIAVLAVGIVLMLLPTSEKREQSTQEAVIQEVTMDEKLCKILSQIRGAGEVSVLLSTVSGQEYIYQSDIDIQSNGTENSSRKDTVIITDSSRNEQGLIKQINPPIYQGAIIVCQGADNPVVKLAVVEAVANITGLGADKITVLKMK